MSLSRGLSAMGVRNYRLFWSGQLISLVGTWMDSVAQSWLILLLTNDPVALGLRAVFQFIPVMVLGLFGGIIADTLPKRATLYVTQAGSGLVALTLGVLTLTGTVQVWHIYVLAAILGCISAVDMPVRQSFVVEMVGREHVVNAVALNSATFNGARIIGPAVGGVLIGAVGVGLCFMLNAASYLAVLAALFMMREVELHPGIRSPVPHSPRAVVDQLAEGLRYVQRTPSVFLAIMVLGIVSTVALNFSVVMPLYAAETLRGDASTYGYLMAAAGVGSLAAALLIAFGMRPTLRLLVIGSALIGIALVGPGDLPVAAGQPAHHGPAGLRHDHDERHHQHPHPAAGARCPARTGDERLHHGVRRDDAHRRPGFGRRHGRGRRHRDAGGRRRADAPHGRCRCHPPVRHGSGGAARVPPEPLA